MPIYEFACDLCRKVYQFYFRSATSRKKPACPKCGKRGLSRRFSRFAAGRSRSGSGADREGSEADLDPARMDRALSKLEREMESLDENDPRQMGRFMRRVMQETGQDLGPEVETAIRRLEAGEDLEKIEEDMGDILDVDSTGPADEYGYDDTLYEA